jgi:aminopeptidase N
LPIPVAFAYIQDEATRTVELKQFQVRIHERDQTLYFPLTDKPDFLCFDVGNHYLKTVALEYPMGELKAQLQFDPDPIARIFAAEALAKKGGLEAVKALHQGIKHDSVWGVRVELIKQLATIPLDQVNDLLN